MSELAERLCVSLVLLGAMILLLLFGHAWLPLSASYDASPHDRVQPALPDWPEPHGRIEYRV